MKHPNNGVKKHVVIIGAGFAGLSAARHLLERSNGGVSVAVLEGGHRVGGRAHTAQLEGCGSVEMGATWLHGLAGNPLFDLAVQEGLMTRTAKPADEAWAHPSWVREGDQVPLAAEEVATAKAAAGSYSMAVEQAMQSEETGLTVGKHLRRTWPQARQKFAAGEKQVAAEVWRWRECLQRSMDGCDSTDNMLAAGLAEYDELDGMNVPVGGGGFQNLAAQLAAGISDIRYGHIVHNINWGEGAAQISCTNGSGFSADAVIVTVSLGVLKAQYSTLFEPQLPSEKVEVIQRMGFGVVNKVFLASQAQLPAAKKRRPLSFSLLWSVEGGDSCPLDDSTSHSWIRDVYSLRQAGSEFVSAKELSLATAGTKPKSGGPVSAEPPSAESHASPKEAPPTAHEPRQSQGRTANLWVTGPGALAMEHRSSAELAADVEQMLDTFPPVRDALPDAASIFRTTWGTDPLFRGSYSFVSAASSLNDLEELGRPVSREDQQPVLFFAGEATHPTHYGTTHGAFITGQREADNVLRTFSMLQ
eukprot:CAMPEP_0206141490 /NCGR_PEP_ID=MMETSP1473-20131121/13113_1 /ASSEMBLY_ACC=CAM_ASM_001109 /TAXON_ID=1461547 /ORGANISM="Stichococcus sp, Strain RCC1054" /LENGTH=529 /DNA_ID=CAMNT_0053536087 /DNA_START=104 /DNA_END=1693 /DNA_ORIENTATION=-